MMHVMIHNLRPKYVYEFCIFVATLFEASGSIRRALGDA